MKQKNKLFFTYLYIASVLLFTFYLLWSQYTERTIQIIESFYYWWILSGLILFVRLYKLKSDNILKYSLVAFLISVSITIFKLDILSGFIASVGFVGFIVGVAMVVWEARKKDGNS